MNVRELGRKIEAVTPETAALAEAAQERLEARALSEVYGVVELQHTDLRPAGKADEYLEHVPSGELYERFAPDREFTRPGRRPQDAQAWYEAANGRVAFLRRPKRGEPQTVAELERQRAEVREARREAERARREQVAALPRRPLLYRDLAGLREALTLVEAARVIEAAGGTIEARAGELVVELPDRVLGRDRALGAARLLFHARDVVVAALEAGDELPNEHPRAGGGI